MKIFLTFDWDFFINASAQERDEAFPSGDLECQAQNDPHICNQVWSELYQNVFPPINLIGVRREEFGYALSMCSSHSGKSCVSRNHQEMYSLVMNNTQPNDEFEVINFDFHHDLYCYSVGNSVNCSNWVSKLMSERPHMRYTWVRNTDSQMSSLGIESVAELDRVQTMTFDTFTRAYKEAGPVELVHLCRSDVWSPPHLDHHFKTLALALSANEECARIRHIFR